MAKRIILTSAVFLVTLIIAVAMLCPSQTYYKYSPDGNADLSFGPSDASMLNDCILVDSDYVKVIGTDPSILFRNVDSYVNFIAINFSVPFTEAQTIQLYYNTGSGFSETNSKKTLTSVDETAVYFELSGAVYDDFRIDIGESCRITSIDFYSTAPEMISERVQVSAVLYILALVLALVIAAVTFISDNYLHYSEKIFSFLHQNRTKFALGVLVTAIAVLSGAIIEFVFSLAISDSFNRYRLTFFSGAVLCVLIFVCNLKSLEKKPENAFLGMILTIGAVAILTAPIGHTSFDTDYHYTCALGASYIGSANISEADYSVKNINFFAGSNPEDCQSVIEKMNTADKILIARGDVDTTIAHRAAGIIIAVVRLFGGSFYLKYICGQFGNLIVYAFACFFAMKKLKSGKLIVAAIAMFPSNLFLATNYSYDYWVTCLSILGISCFISELQQPDKPLRLRNSILMCGTLGVACLPKLVYVPLLLVPLLIKKNKISKKTRRRHYSVCAISMVCVLVLFALRSITEATGTGDLRGGDVNPSEQLKFILSDPLGYAGVLFDFMKTWLLDLNTYYTEIFFLGEYRMAGRAELCMFILLFVTLTDKSDCDAYKNRVAIRIAGITLFLSTFALIGTSMYIAFTPLGSDYISGVQQRYLTPLLFPALIGFAPTRTMRIKRRALYNGAILIALSLVLIYAFGDLYLPKVADCGGILFAD